MEYNFTDEILDIIKHKTTDLFNKLDESDTNLEKEVEQNLETKVEQNLEKEVEQNLEKEVEQNLEKEVEQNLEKEAEQNLEKEVEQNLEKEVEQNLEKEVEQNLENNVNKDKLILDFLEKFKLFHNDSRANISLLKYIIHKKIGKIKESDNLILFKELNKFTNNKEITELIWEYIHSVYLLHEYALLEPNKEILSALIQKINVENEDENNNSNSLTIIEDKDKEEEKEEDKDIFDKIKDKKEFKMFNDVFNSITKNMDVDPTTANTNFIDDIMDDIRTNINNSDGVDDLFNSTKNIGEKYKNMYNDGKINMNDLMSSMMKIMSNPQNISKTIKDINVKKIPDMSSIVNKLVTEVQSSDDIKNMMNSDMLKNINFDPNKKDFNPMDIISNMMSGASTSTTVSASADESPLTNEQITEMENFYSNLNIGNESN
jgi:hypothetical protein